MVKHNPNDMRWWDEITCQRGPAHEHHTRLLRIDLKGETGYKDFTSIPDQLATRFLMEVWDPEQHPVDGGPYCPAHDAISENLVNLGCWEPRETVLTLWAAINAPEGAIMLDFGAQMGWFSLLVASCGRTVHAYDAEQANLELLTRNAETNGWEDRIIPLYRRFDEDSAPDDPFEDRVFLAKIDVEGAERDVIRVLGPSLHEGRIDHLLVEVTPVFDGYYGQLVNDLVHYGYRPFLMPEASIPPRQMDPLRRSLTAITETGPELIDLVNSWHQENLLFIREGL